MSDKIYSLSKTSFLKFDQCQKAFFLYKNHPYLRDKISVDKQLTFKRGHDVGFYAQQLFPGGIDVSKETKNVAQAAELTKQLIQNQTSVIYEATFVFNGVLVMIDILCLNDGIYTAYEIKSSLKVSEVYLKDAYLQYYVIKNNLPQLDDLFLVTLNQDYLMEEQTDPKKLFKRRSTKQKALENFSFFEHKINEAYQLLEQNAIPNIAIGKQCFRPYQCDFFGSCWKDVLHEKSIFNLPLVDKNKLFEWYDSGLSSMEQIEDSLIEKENNIVIKNALLNNRIFSRAEIIKQFVEKIKLPVAAMDMEIWNPAIPQIKGTGPFEQIPFLVCFYNGSNNPHFFAEHQSDQRRQFAEELCVLSESYASILVYDKTMEVAVIDMLAKKHPEFSVQLAALKNKLVDVFELILNVDYYHPAFKNNFSLKSVSGVLLSDVSYNQIGSGLEAMNYFDQYRAAEVGEQKEELKQQLISYCHTDCLATFGLFEFFSSQFSN